MSGFQQCFTPFDKLRANGYLYGIIYVAMYSNAISLPVEKIGVLLV